MQPLLYDVIILVSDLAILFFSMFAVLLLLGFAALVHGQLVIPGGTTFTSAQHWFLSDSPVSVQGALTISGFGSLIIDAGVVVNVAAGVRIINQRTLRVMGTSLLPVIKLKFL